MSKKRLEACRSHDDFVSYASKRGGRIENGGRHTKIYSPDGGMAIVPRHPGDLAKGTRFSIIKTLIKIGLALIPIALLINFWI
jgi:hypothetical protein